MAKPRVPKKTSDNTGVPPVEASANAVTVESTAADPTNGKAKRSNRKPVVVKSEPRANLVPINVEDEIRQLAYLLSERRGFEPGHETEDWLAAEQEVRTRYHQHSA
jgi:hypothetical protein